MSVYGFSEDKLKYEIDNAESSITVDLFNSSHIQLTRIGRMVFWTFWTDRLVPPYSVGLGQIPQEFRPKIDQVVPTTEYASVIIAGSGSLDITTSGWVFMRSQNKDYQFRNASGAYVVAD